MTGVFAMPSVLLMVGVVLAVHRGVDVVVMRWPVHIVIVATAAPELIQPVRTIHGRSLVHDSTIPPRV